MPDGSRLIQMARIEGGPAGKLELKRVYDRAGAAAAPLRQLGAPRVERQALGAK